jgi:hypothetical protein
MTVRRLTRTQRGALLMLATAGRDGATQSLLSAHGFSAAMIARLVNRGLATMTREKLRADGKIIEVGKVRITDAGVRLYCSLRSYACQADDPTLLDEVAA